MSTRPRSHAKQKNKTATLGDLNAFILLEWAVIFLVAIFLTFQIAALENFNSSLRANLSLSAFASKPVIMESLNYHGYQEPVNFPPALLPGKVGGLVSSQEYRLPSQAVLKYVSFKSAMPLSELKSYYEKYLEEKAFVLRALEIFSDGLTFRAERSNLRLDFDLASAAEGSTVSIYYRGVF